MDAFHVGGWILMGLGAVYAVVGTLACVQRMIAFKKREQEFQVDRKRIQQEIRDAKARRTKC